MTNLKLFQELDKNLRGNLTWAFYKEGLEIFHGDSKNTNSITVTLVPAAVLDQLHPNLHATLEVLRKHTSQGARRSFELRRDYSDGRYPLACIRHLVSPLVVQDVRGHKAALACIWNISWEPTDKRVLLHTMSYDMPENPDANGVFIPTRVSSQQMSVTKEWMTETYPGWENRLSSAVSLGLKEDELALFVCNSDSTNLEMSLPENIQFG